MALPPSPLAGLPRADPTAGLRVYAGGFRPLDAHYYAALAFAGAFGAALAAACLLLPVVLALAVCARCVARCCCLGCPADAEFGSVGVLTYPPRRAPRRAARAAALLGAAVAVAGAACVWAAGHDLRRLLASTLSTALAQAQLVLTQSDAVQAALATASPTFASLGYPTDELDAAADTLRRVADAIRAALASDPRFAFGALDRLALACTLLGAALIALALLTALAVLRSRRALCATCVALLWLWLVLGWLLCGGAYVASLLAADACAALPRALAHPAASGASALVPCLAPSFGDDTAAAARRPVFQTVDTTNVALRSCSSHGPLPPADFLCNPVVAVANASAAGGTTYADASAACAPPYSTPMPAFAAAYTAASCPGIPPLPLAALGAGVAAAAALVAVLPQLDALAGCAGVLRAARAAEAACPPLRRAAWRLFAGLLAADVAFTALLAAALWAARAPRRRRRRRRSIAPTTGGELQFAVLTDEAPPPHAHRPHHHDQHPQARKSMVVVL